MEKIFVFFALSFAVFSLACGLWCVRRPREVIVFQQRFYSRINWRLEPLCWKKEERNTVVMGIFLLTLSAATILSLFVR